MGRPSRFSPEVRERAVRMIEEHREAHASEWAVLQSVAPKLGCTAETLRKWVRQAQRDVGHRPGLTTSERERLKELERENRELKRANEILRKASAYFAQAEARPPREVMVRFIPIIGRSTGSSRSARCCRSPHRRITAIAPASSIRSVGRRVRNVMTCCGSRFSASSTSTIRSTGLARCGSSCTARPSAWHGVPSGA
jgi:transposase